MCSKIASLTDFCRCRGKRRIGGAPASNPAFGMTLTIGYNACSDLVQLVCAAFMYYIVRISVIPKEVSPANLSFGITMAKILKTPFLQHTTHISMGKLPDRVRSDMSWPGLALTDTS